MLQQLIHQKRFIYHRSHYSKCSNTFACFLVLASPRLFLNFVGASFQGRAGVPLEVMGIMLGEVLDDYTVTVVDVFAMPQSGTGVSVEAVDPVFQTKMMDLLRQTNRLVISLFVFSLFIVM